MGISGRFKHIYRVIVTMDYDGTVVMFRHHWMPAGYSDEYFRPTEFSLNRLHKLLLKGVQKKNNENND